MSSPVTGYKSAGGMLTVEIIVTTLKKVFNGFQNAPSLYFKYKGRVLFPFFVAVIEPDVFISGYQSATTSKTLFNPAFVVFDKRRIEEQGP